MAFVPQRDIYVKEVLWANKNRHQFRQLARESSGEIFDPPEGSRMFLAYYKGQGQSRDRYGQGQSRDRYGQGQSRDGYGQSEEKLVGVASYSPATAKDLDPTKTRFDSPYFHVITYLFVKPCFQQQGCGSYILSCVEKNIKSRTKRPIRVQSAEKAVRFFEKHGYQTIGEPIDCVYGGSPLFSRLYNMEKDITKPQ